MYLTISLPKYIAERPRVLSAELWISHKLIFSLAMFTKQIRLAKFSLAGNIIKYCKSVFLYKVTIITCFSKIFASALLQLCPILLRKKTHQHFCNSKFRLNRNFTHINIVTGFRESVHVSLNELRIIRFYTLSVRVFWRLGFKSDDAGTIIGPCKRTSKLSNLEHYIRK